MIVADVNLLVYLLIDGEFTEAAERCRLRDRRWIAPRSHRFEFLNVLATNVRAGVIERNNVDELWKRAFRLMVTAQDVDPMNILDLSVASKIATYDCEYVALARDRRLRLVTNDRKVLETFEDVAVSIEDFADGR